MPGLVGLSIHPSPQDWQLLLFSLIVREPSFLFAAGVSGEAVSAELVFIVPRTEQLNDKMSFPSIIILFIIDVAKAGVSIIMFILWKTFTEISPRPSLRPMGFSVTTIL